MAILGPQLKGLDLKFERDKDGSSGQVITGFLLATNVPSELTRPQSDPNVEAWLSAADDEELYPSVVSLGEIFKGLTGPASEQAPPGTAAVD